MNVLTAPFEALAALLDFRLPVRGHSRQQAYGPRRLKNRRRRINGYKRRRAR